VGDFYSWLVFGHVLAAFAFAFAHGTSAMVIVRLHRERDPDQVRSLLALSMGSLRVANIAGILLIIFGVWAGFEGDLWTGDRLWLWAAVVVLVVVLFAMYGLISRHTYAWRKALDAVPPADRGTLATMMDTSQPLTGALAGGGASCSSCG
jgi:hypothetical protein